MPNFFKKLSCGIALVLAVLAPGNIFAQDTVDSRYFKITIHQGVSQPELLKKLHADYFLRMNAAFSISESNSAEFSKFLGQTLDAIYLNVSDILDIHMYTFSVELEVYPDRSALADELQKYMDRKIDVPSFYYYDKNKIYISFGDLTLGMLSHEIAHAIISHYFVVQPSVKIQEVLAGYVEYSINKAAK